MTVFRDLFRWRGPKSSPRSRPHLVADHWPAALYVIGDVHGCLAQLQELEALIVADAAGISGEKWIVTLGDYIDRGPDSAGVLDHLLSDAPLPGFERFCLAGNHEAMMLSFLSEPTGNPGWLSYGGLETVRSYGLAPEGVDWDDPRASRAAVRAAVPPEHVDFLKRAPLYLELPGLVCVHAGIRPGVPLERQREADLLWIRDEFFGGQLPTDPMVVHGHTPGLEPVVTPRRICIDTGAFATGKLTALRLAPEPRIYLQSSRAVRSR